MLSAGTRLGPYEIVSLVGVGGMGEVYKGRDTRLDRTVAIKLLPADVSERADRRARFETEARAISSLNHPHICTLFDVGEDDGRHFIVMEYLEGETLNDRRHVSIHGARAARRQGSGRAHGHLRVRHAAVRDGDGPQGVRRREPGEPDCIDSDGAAASDFVDADERWSAGRARSRRGALPREEP